MHDLTHKAVAKNRKKSHDIFDINNQKQSSLIKNTLGTHKSNTQTQISQNAPVKKKIQPVPVITVPTTYNDVDHLQHVDSLDYGHLASSSSNSPSPSVSSASVKVGDIGPGCSWSSCSTGVRSRTNIRPRTASYSKLSRGFNNSFSGFFSFARFCLQISFYIIFLFQLCFL